MKAYHGEQEIKDAVLAQLEMHRLADELVKGQYWEDGKGCAVGCTIYSDDHEEYENLFGIPQMLAHLEDTIFEGLPNGQAKAWPEKFMRAAPVGADLSLVGWKFIHWLLTDETATPGISAPSVRDAVQQCAGVIKPLTKGLPADQSAAWSAENAAWSGESASGSAESAGNAAWNAARSAAKSAEGNAGGSAVSAAESAVWSAISAAEGAWSAGGAGGSAKDEAYIRMSEKLLNLMREAT